VSSGSRRCSAPVLLATGVAANLANLKLSASDPARVHHPRRKCRVETSLLNARNIHHFPDFYSAILFFVFLPRHLITGKTQEQNLFTSGDDIKQHDSRRCSCNLKPNAGHT
jgi:hypothetical protein